MRPLNPEAFAFAEVIDLLDRPRGPVLADLERDLSGLISDHLADTRERLDVPMVEFEQDMKLLETAAAGLAQAAAAIAELTRNNISFDSPSQTPAAISDLFTEALDDLMQPSAARVLAASVALSVQAQREGA